MAWLQSTERMTYLYHRWEQVFGKDELDLLLWIMILLILHDSITSWAGPAKITAHQATTVTLKVFSKEKLENSGKTKTPKGDKYEEKPPGPIFAIVSTQDCSTGPAGFQAPTMPWCSGECPQEQPYHDQGDTGTSEPQPKSHGLSVGWLL